MKINNNNTLLVLLVNSNSDLPRLIFGIYQTNDMKKIVLILSTKLGMKTKYIIAMLVQLIIPASKFAK